MRSYDQCCPVARALDVIGDRWNLLIVRELLLRDRCRYTDLRHGVPGIATNLLADRLRDLERAGVLFSEDAPPPIATSVFALTERGRALAPVLRELAAWGAPLLDEDPGGAFRTHWMGLLAEVHLTDNEPEQPPVAVQLDTPEDPMILETVDGRVRARSGRLQHPDLVLTGDGKLIAGLLSDRVTLAEARRQGLATSGSMAALRRIRPHESGRAPAAAALA